MRGLSDRIFRLGHKPVVKTITNVSEKYREHSYNILAYRPVISNLRQVEKSKDIEMQRLRLSSLFQQIRDIFDCSSMQWKIVW